VRADDAAPAFGTRHTVVLSAENLVGYVHNSENGLISSNDAVTFLTSTAWAFDAFVVGHLSLGGAASFSSSNPSPAGPLVVVSNTLGVTLSLRAGYAVALGRRLALWPRASVDCSYFQSVPQREIAESTDTNLLLDVQVPLVISVAPHLFLEVALRLAHTLADDPSGPDPFVRGGRVTSLADSAARGGYF
jgi:hypothetical protein